MSMIPAPTRPTRPDTRFPYTPLFRCGSAGDSPPADRPVAPTVSTKWSSEEARDRVNEAEDVMDSADGRPGMTVADIGAGDGYYTVRLAQRVGANGRVLAQDIMPEVDRKSTRLNSSH